MMATSIDIRGMHLSPEEVIKDHRNPPKNRDCGRKVMSGAGTGTVCLAGKVEIGTGFAQSLPEKSGRALYRRSFGPNNFEENLQSRASCGGKIREVIRSKLWRLGKNPMAAAWLWSATDAPSSWSESERRMAQRADDGFGQNWRNRFSQIG